MFSWKSLTFSAVTAGILTAAAVAPAHSAQISINIGAAPACPYGYFDYVPYDCAPYGYYGPDWFVGGAFLGAGPWFHGPHGFHGHVDNRYDPHHGYHGPVPDRGSQQFNHFNGNEARDGQGHTVDRPSHQGGGEHALPGFHGGGGGAPHGAPGGVAPHGGGAHGPR